MVDDRTKGHPPDVSFCDVLDIVTGYAGYDTQRNRSRFFWKSTEHNPVMGILIILSDQSTAMQFFVSQYGTEALFNTLPGTKEQPLFDALHSADHCNNEFSRLCV